MDNCNSYEYSKIISINYTDKASSRINIDKVIATTSQLQLEVYSNKIETVTLKVTDVLGHTILQKRVQLQAGINNIVQPMSTIKAVLFCRVISQSERSDSKSVVVQ